jgi:hypothetical protein
VNRLDLGIVCQRVFSQLSSDTGLLESTKGNVVVQLVVAYVANDQYRAFVGVEGAYS